MSDFRFANNLLKSSFERKFDVIKEEKGVEFDTELTAEDLMEVVEIYKAEYKIIVVIRNGRNIPEHLFKSLVKKPLIRFFLNFNEVGHINNLFDFRKAHSLVITELYRFNLDHRL